MPRPFIALCVVGFILAQVAATLSFKVAADRAGWEALRWFIIGNVVGFLCPVCLTLALRGTNANVIYAVCYGVAFCLIQVGAWWLFRQALTPYQWTGIGLVALGIVLLQWR
jgi:multidrug transporter EmrE-like cation transporter